MESNKLSKASKRRSDSTRSRSSRRKAKKKVWQDEEFSDSSDLSQDMDEEEEMSIHTPNSRTATFDSDHSMEDGRSADHQMREMQLKMAEMEEMQKHMQRMKTQETETLPHPTTRLSRAETVPTVFTPRGLARHQKMVSSRNVHALEEVETDYMYAEMQRELNRLTTVESTRASRGGPSVFTFDRAQTLPNVIPQPTSDITSPRSLRSNSPHPQSSGRPSMTQSLSLGASTNRVAPLMGSAPDNSPAVVAAGGGMTISLTQHPTGHTPVAAGADANAIGGVRIVGADMLFPSTQLTSTASLDSASQQYFRTSAADSNSPQTEYTANPLMGNAFVVTQQHSQSQPVTPVQTFQPPPGRRLSTLAHELATLSSVESDGERRQLWDLMHTIVIEENSKQKLQLHGELQRRMSGNHNTIAKDLITTTTVSPNDDNSNRLKMIHQLTIQNQSELRNIHSQLETQRRENEGLRGQLRTKNTEILQLRSDNSKLTTMAVSVVEQHSHSPLAPFIPQPSMSPHPIDIFDTVGLRQAVRSRRQSGVPIDDEYQHYAADNKKSGIKEWFSSIGDFFGCNWCGGSTENREVYEKYAHMNMQQQQRLDSASSLSTI